MTELGPYTVHPLADVFPLLEGDEFDELVLSIKEHGLQTPIVLSTDESTVIDGRNRYRACMEAGVDPVFRTISDRYDEVTIAHFIIRANVRRRNLNPGQLALVGVEFERAFARMITDGHESAVADLPPPHSKSRELAAEVVGASPRTIQQAKAVVRDAPDLAAQVHAGTLALDAADRQRKVRARNLPKPAKERSSAETLHLVTDDGTVIDYPKPKAKPKFNETGGEGISWAAWSWNPVTGCRHECRYCYARDLANRSSYSATYPVGFTPLFHHERLDAPANTTIPKEHADDPEWRRVFVCSMADLYGKWVPKEWIDQVHTAMLAAPEWEYLLLTKFPSRYKQFELPPRAWVGTSVDTQRRVNIAENAFRDIEGVHVKWLSLEPLLEPLVFRDLSVFDWVVIGAQTETVQPWGVEPAVSPKFEWVADLVAQAREAGCRVHLKPNLRTVPGMDLPNEYPEGNA
jgi:protein gp37/ParB-like chromosome segregation protein Spo0J